MTRSRRLVLALVIDLVLVVGEALGGVLAHSTGLVATAGHDLADAAALVLALAAARLALRPATAARSFGYHRATILAALANATAIVIVALGVVALAAWRLAEPAHVQGWVVVVFASAGLLGNSAAALVLREHSHDLNFRAVALHFGGDAVAALGVIIAGTVIIVTGRFEAIDPAVALLITLLIAAKAWRLVRTSLEVLLESTPADLDVGALASAISSTEGVTAVHDLHCWSLSSDVRALSAHIVLDGHPSLEEAQVVGERVKASVARHFNVAHATLEMECEPCADDVAVSCAVDPVSRVVS
ncbi:MAG: cation diffusion facilitator family transporter [Acidimicrobiales bacterium]|jgi:cobalt-zinc-cadmium efflux system protein